MGTIVQVIHPSDFLRVRADGRADIETAKVLLAEVAKAATKLEAYQVLIDIRDGEGQLTADELHELAGTLITFRDTFLHRTAILSPRERFDNARFFSLLAASHGFGRIRAFVSYEDAMEWLLAPAEA